MTADRPRLGQVNLVVADMDASVAFYRRLGLSIDAEPGAQHVAIEMAGGIRLELDSTEFAPQWDSGWKSATGGGAVIGFALPLREAVDEAYDALTRTGGAARQRPYDAFWGARYAIVEDPDGHPVGLMSPIEEGHKFWPPEPPPALDR